MNRSHAFWSFGFFGAGLLGAMAARVGISPQWHLAGIVPFSALLILLLLGGFEAAPQRSDGNDEPAHHLVPAHGDRRGGARRGGDRQARHDGEQRGGELHVRTPPPVFTSRLPLRRFATRR